MSVEKAEIAAERKAVGFASANAGRTAVLVPGMHRSGTSALARVLNLLGCDISHSLLSANEFNERGYWEDPFFLDINERMLQSAGLSWNSWESLSDDWYASAKPSQFMKEAIALVDEKFGGSSLFVIKDPRISRLIPFWRRVLDEMSITVKAVIPVRRPAEVAASLQHRDRLNAHQAQLVWLRYNLDSEYGTRGLDRAFLTYDQMLDDWRTTMTSVRDNLGDFTWPRQSASAFGEIDAFLSADLRHHVEKKKRSPDESPWAREVWTILQRWALEGAKKDDEAKLDVIRSTLGQAESNFARVLIEYQKYGESVAASLKATTEALEANVALTELHQAAFSEIEGALVAQKEKSTSDEAAAELRASELSGDVETTISRLTATLAELDDLKAAKAALEAQLAEAVALGAAARSGEEAAVARLTASRIEAGEIDGARTALEARLAEVEARLSASMSAEASISAQLAATRGELEDLRAASLALQDERAAAEARWSSAVVEVEDLRAASLALQDERAAADARWSSAAVELESERARWLEKDKALANLLEREEAFTREASEHAAILAAIKSELCALQEDAISDAEETKRLALLISDQEEQIARLKVWLASSQKNSDFYQKALSGAGDAPPMFAPDPDGRTSPSMVVGVP